MWCVGFFSMTREGMIFGFWEDWLERTKKVDGNDEYIIPDVIGKPLGRCIWCVASLQGFIVYALYFLIEGLQLSVLNILVIVPLVAIASPLNAFVWNLIKYIEKLNDE